MKQGLGIREQGLGLVLVSKPVQKVEAASVVREATTGRVVSAVARPAVKGKLLMLPRVWAVAETGGAVEVLMPPIAFPRHDDDAAFDVVHPTHDDGTVVNGAPNHPTHDDDAVVNGAPNHPTHDDDAVVNGVPASVEAPPVELAFYRKYTEGMLRRYVRLSMAAGRVPSLLGRELFRGHVSSYRMTNFEDVVVFCFDMEKLLARLQPMDQQLIKRIGMQEYKHGEAASMLRISLRTCMRTYGQAVDRLTEMLLEARMLEPLNR